MGMLANLFGKKKKKGKRGADWARLHPDEEQPDDDKDDDDGDDGDGDDGD